MVWVRRGQRNQIVLGELRAANVNLTNGRAVSVAKFILAKRTRRMRMASPLAQLGCLVGALAATTNMSSSGRVSAGQTHWERLEWERR